MSNHKIPTTGNPVHFKLTSYSQGGGRSSETQYVVDILDGSQVLSSGWGSTPREAAEKAIKRLLEFAQNAVNLWNVSSLEKI